MYKSSLMNNESEEDIPSWLKDDKNVMGGTANRSPQVQAQQPTQRAAAPNLLSKRSTSYGGQSASSSAEFEVEVDYGDSDADTDIHKNNGEAAETSTVEPNANPEISWADDPPNGKRGKTKESNYGSAVFQDAQEEEEDSSWEEDSSDDDGDGDGDADDDDSESDDESESDGSEDDDEEKNGKKQRWHEEPANEKTALRQKRRRPKKRRGDRVAEEDVLIKPRRNCCHSFFIIVQIAAVLANICMITLEVVPAIYVLRSGRPETLQILDVVLRSYFTFFSLLFLLAELEWFNSSLGNWITKGFLYSFLGVVAKEQHLAMLANGTLVVKENTKAYWNGVWAALFVQVSSWWIIGIGVLYFLMGIFCLKRMRNRFREQYQVRLTEYKAAVRARR